MQFRRSSVLVSLILAFVSGGLEDLRAASSPGAASIVLTSVFNGTEPSTEIHCDGVLHGYIRLPAPTTGTHKLRAIWFFPSGKMASQSDTSLTFTVPTETAYVWLNFPETQRQGLLTSIDPELDAIRLASRGTWRVDVLWDGKKILHQTFNVKCE